MSEVKDRELPKSSRLAEYGSRNGKPNAHVVSDQKAGANGSNNKPAPSTKGGCSCS